MTLEQVEKLKLQAVKDYKESLPESEDGGHMCENRIGEELDNILYQEEMNWCYCKPTKAKYTKIYIYNQAEEDEEEEEEEEEIKYCWWDGNILTNLDRPPHWGIEGVDYVIDNIKEKGWAGEYSIKQITYKKKEEEEEEMVHCVGCNEPVCKFTEEPPHKDDRDEAVCEDCYVFLEKEEVCELCGGQNEKEASCRVSEYDSYTLCDDCIPPDSICSVKEWNERWTKKGKDTFDFDRMKWKEEEEEDSQYKELCAECKTQLTIDTPIMCYFNKDDSKSCTLCNECYWDCDYWRSDINEDNQEEIEQHKEDLKCDRCGHDDIGWCMSNGCDKGQRRIEAMKEEGIITEEGK